MTSITITAVNNTINVTEDSRVTSVEVPITSVITATTAGPQGPAGAAAQGYVHTQTTAASTWTINHNLGYYPIVEIFDSGRQEIDADVSHPSTNQTVIVVLLPLTGFARLI
jgi:hypothetical protein